MTTAPTPPPEDTPQTPRYWRCEECRVLRPQDKHTKKCPLRTVDDDAEVQ